MASLGREFEASVQPGPNGGAFVELPFDPSEVWGVKERHHVNGSVGGVKVRGPLTRDSGVWRLSLGRAWLATFYRKGYLQWLDGASRRPELRKQRIEEWVQLLREGRKTRGQG